MVTMQSFFRWRRMCSTHHRQQYHAQQQCDLQPCQGFQSPYWSKTQPFSTIQKLKQGYKANRDEACQFVSSVSVSRKQKERKVRLVVASPKIGSSATVIASVLLYVKEKCSVWVVARFAEVASEVEKDAAVFCAVSIEMVREMTKKNVKKMERES
ncbi:hypothetical protein DVH24_016070 [Malus domestica]|uniref:Uncharacterized protein n=1 Tax=Malus domestica TaxID=3750 RepID=A0A498JJN9_MALDO|nr:hypothetical protein DVH24_016070 [Malus domestica]